MIMSDEMIAKFKQVHPGRLDGRYKAEMARVLGSWFEANMGQDSSNIKDVRQISDRLLAVIYEEPVQGEYIIFVNNYVAFLILECEKDLSRQLLDKWIRKVKETGNIEWRLLLFSSYVELVVRSSDPMDASAKVTKIVNHISRHIDSTKTELLTATILRSYCTILVNHAKLTLAIEDGEDTVDKVKEIVKRIRKYNSTNEPDQTIEKIVSRIESIYRPQESDKKSAARYSIVAKERSVSRGQNSKNTNSSIVRQSIPSSSFELSGFKMMSSGLRGSDAMHSSSRNFRISNSSNRKKSIGGNLFKKTLTEQYRDRPAMVYKKAAQSEEHMTECDQETDYTEIKALKETTQIALQGLLEVRRNKQLLRDFQGGQPEREDQGSRPKVDFITKLDKLRQVMSIQINDLKVYNDKIDHLERFNVKRVKNDQSGKSPSESKTKQPDQEDSTSPIKTDPFIGSHPVLAEVKKGSMRDIAIKPMLPTESNRVKVCASEGQRSLISRGNSCPMSEVELVSPTRFEKPERETAAVYLPPPKRLDTSGLSSLNDLQNIFLSSYHAFKLELKQMPKDPLMGTTNQGSMTLQYCFSMTYRKSEKAFVFGLAVNKLNHSQCKSHKALSESQFIGLCVALLKDQDNHLNFSGTTPFSVILKHCILSKVKVDQS